MEGGEEKSCDKSVETEAGRERKGGMGKEGRKVYFSSPPSCGLPPFVRPRLPYR